MSYGGNWFTMLSFDSIRGRRQLVPASFIPPTTRQGCSCRHRSQSPTTTSSVEGNFPYG